MVGSHARPAEKVLQHAARSPRGGVDRVASQGGAALLLGEVMVSAVSGQIVGWVVEFFIQPFSSH